MLRLFVAGVAGFLIARPGIAFEYDCAPHCDYVHDYGPYDFSWVSPGLFGYPHCDREGDCSPHLVYRRFGQPWPGVTITVRPTSRRYRDIC